jgi:hypothetical protein
LEHRADEVVVMQLLDAHELLGVTAGSDALQQIYQRR